MEDHMEEPGLPDYLTEGLSEAEIQLVGRLNQGVYQTKDFEPTGKLLLRVLLEKFAIIHGKDTDVYVEVEGAAGAAGTEEEGASSSEEEVGDVEAAVASDERSEGEPAAPEVAVPHMREDYPTQGDASPQVTPVDVEEAAQQWDPTTRQRNLPTAVPVQQSESSEPAWKPEYPSSPDEELVPPAPVHSDEGTKGNLDLDAEN
jgi:hypothetical protein